MSCSVGHVGRRCSLDVVLLWLWSRTAFAALIQPLPRELLYAAGAAVKRKNYVTLAGICELMAFKAIGLDKMP